MHAYQKKKKFTLDKIMPNFNLQKSNQRLNFNESTTRKTNSLIFFSYHFWDSAGFCSEGNYKQTFVIISNGISLGLSTGRKCKGLARLCLNNTETYQLLSYKRVCTWTYPCLHKNNQQLTELVCCSLHVSVTVMV